MRFLSTCSPRFCSIWFLLSDYFLFRFFFINLLWSFHSLADPLLSLLCECFPVIPSDCFMNLRVPFSIFHLVLAGQGASPTSRLYKLFESQNSSIDEVDYLRKARIVSSCRLNRISQQHGEINAPWWSGLVTCEPISTEIRNITAN